MSKKVLVIKLGTAIISNKEGNIEKNIIRKIAAEIASLSKQYNVILVSSGAVGSGKKFLHNYKGTLSERKAAAAIGNPILIQQYRHYFQPFGITVAQALCERVHFSNRSQFLQLKETFETFWANQAIPVVNENDLVSNVEIKFSDNDELATLIAIGFDAAAMILCTSAGGLLDDQKKVIPRVKKIDASLQRFVDHTTSGVGLGGMLSKLTFTRLAVSLGITVIICGLSGSEPLSNALGGTNGTYFEPSSSTLRSRQKWLASGSVTLGTITVDKGAAKALQNRKSLLTVGIREVDGKFIAGEVVQLKDEDRTLLGVAKSKLDATLLREQLTHKNVVAAHADDIVLF
ncbi:glutamate 5-kinase [Flavihumibacter petaseus]|uniref:Glutamate 5-kinase n=1 Tax=Flavihumibacter petaseus NBRC 106054 TaxID=1220578 RepID=A0A0E9N0A1_9BACT|nr:glutamate 5-kinase [Flavihumibacter petaseus]GAO43208.1 glutamate 5-kinase [Flavihumibacter petaseus NBRC 106054]